MITIIDYGVGNIGSIQNMLNKIGHDSIITSDPDEIEASKKLILPGVGKFDYGIQQLRERNIIEVLNKKVLGDKVPILGICLGLQLFTKKSEEGDTPGLDWIDAETVKFKFKNQPNLKIPNMGWLNTEVKKESKLFTDMPLDPRFYFVHSYHLKCATSQNVILSATYGYEYTCAIEKENILGVQFHPEKSHKFGMKLLQNFVELY